MIKPFYDPDKTYDENFDKGPFGVFRNGKIYHDKKPPQYTFLGYKVNLPFGIPAGPLLNSKFVKGAFEKGFDVVHYKTQRSKVFAVNEFPNVLFIDVKGNLTLRKAEKPLIGKRETKKNRKSITITNSFGNPSRGPKYWQKDLMKAVGYERNGQLLIASVVGTTVKGGSEEDYYDDFAKTAKLAKEGEAKVIEVNLSCPNVANEGVLCYSEEAVYLICRKIKSKIGTTPLLAKVGYFSASQDELLEKIVRKIIPFVSGISAINTIPASVVDEKGRQALPGVGRLKSGICGASIKWAGLDMVKRLFRLRDKLHAHYEIVGVGGVMGFSDYIEYRKKGADLVQSATGAMWNPYLAQEIKEKLG